LDRELRFAIVQQAPPEATAVLSPSQAMSTTRALPQALETRTVAPGLRIASADLLLATDKGTAIHEAFRILLQRPDLVHRVAAHCRLDEYDVATLAAQAGGLRSALANLGYAELHVEQPLGIALPDGGTQSAIIDLIAEGPEGYVIVDHKSGAVVEHAERFATYWPQLAAYVDAVAEIGKKPINGVAVFWTDTGELTIASGLLATSSALQNA